MTLYSRIMKRKLEKSNSKLIGVHNTYKQLEKDNHQCLSLIRDSALPIFFLSPKGLITYANRSFLKMVGYSNSELSTISIYSIIESEIVGNNPNSIFTNILKKQHANEEALEIQFRRKTGEIGWVSIESFTYKRETVNYERFIQCVLKDITREKELRAETDQLHKINQEQATMFRNIVENIEADIVIKKIDNTIVWANRHFLDLYDFSLEEIVGKTALNLWSVENAKKIDSARSVAIQNKERNTIELFVEDKGRKYNVLVTIAPILNEYGVVKLIAEINNSNQSKGLKNEQKWVCAGPLCTRRMLSGFFDKATTPIYGIDFNGRLATINQAFADFYGMSKDELNGKSKEEVDTLLGINVNGVISEMDQLVVKSGESIAFECDMLHPVSKKIIQISFNKFPLYSFDGEIYGVGTIMDDITQIIEDTIELENTRRNADLYKLKAEYHEYILQSYIDNIPHYVSIINLEGKVEFINQYALNLWGETKENVFSKHYTEFIKNDRFLLYIAQDLESVINEQKYIETEEVLSRLDKEDIVFLSTVFPLFNKNGVLFAIGIFRKDITDRKHSEQERWRLQEDVKKQHALLSSIIDSAQDFISVKNKEHRYIMANLAFAKALHLSPSDFIGKDDLELGFPEELVKGNSEKGIPGFWDDNQKVMGDGQIMIIPNEPVTVDGEIHTFHTTKTPLKNADGQVWGVLTFSRDITDELRQQEALRQAKELFKVLYNSTPAMLYSIDKEGEIINVSDYWLEVMGYDREEVLGKKLSCFVTTESLQYSREVVWPVFMKNGSCFNEEFQFIKKDREIITCLLSAIAERDDDGQLVGSLEVLVDITELKKKEVEIVNTKRLLQDFLDNIPYPVMILDLQERITILNDACAHLSSKTKQEMIGQHHNEYMPDTEFQKSIEEGNAYVLKNRQPINLQEKMTLLSGETIFITTYKFPLYNSTEELSYIGIIINDITDKVKREEELVEAQQASETSKQLLKSFMDNATSAMFAKDENGIYIITNKKKEEYEVLRKLARSNSELNSLDFYNSELSRIDDARVITKNAPMTFYDRLLSNDGSGLYTETVKFPIYDKNNKLIGVGGITKDITDSVIREKELEEARQKAENAASSQERFLASMSHDMRTPLNGVVGMINLLEQTSLSAEQKEYMEAMKVSSYNLRVLINDILDVSKIQAGKLNIERVLFDLNEILVSVNNVFSHEASRKGVVFSIELPPDTPVMLEGDPSRLNQILNNLIGNALKFTAQGFVKLKLEHENLVDDKVNIEFVIEDSGIGISEEGLDKLFQPFVQASSDTSRKFGGSGLGLSICMSLVELQQGEISVSSELNKGSIFRFSIPYIKAKQSEIEKAKQQNNVSESVDVKPLPPMRCLVFEDNLINQKVAFHTLKKVGITADLANNGKIGVDILKKNVALYDFVLMDIQMPEMGGYEATRVIRNELGLKIPIIAMTASALKGEKERCIETGMDDFVPKPFVIDELLYVIRKLTKENQKVETILQPSIEDTDNKIKNEAIEQHAWFGDEPLYDMSNVLEIDDHDFTLEILDMFLDTVPKALEELKTGIAQATDWDTVTKVAHKLKGGVGVLQMNEMIKQLSTIEIDAKNRENLDQLQESLNICFEIYDAVKDEITKLRDETMNNK